MIAFLCSIVFPVMMAFAAANDLFTMRIPNRISLVLIAAFVGAALLAGISWQAAGLHVATGMAMLVATFALFSFGLFGGGDAKLMATVALWMGPDHVLPFVVYTTLFGGVLALAVLFYRRFVPISYLPVPEWASRLHDKDSGIPYGIAIALAALVIFPETIWFKALAL